MFLYLVQQMEADYQAKISPNAMIRSCVHGPRLVKEGINFPQYLTPWLVVLKVAEKVGADR
jgi:hypothetical protein